jgi:hypothetical protein
MIVREAPGLVGRLAKFPLRRQPAPNRSPYRAADTYDRIAEACDCATNAQDGELVLASGGGRMILVAALLGTAFWVLLFWLLFG